MKNHSIRDNLVNIIFVVFLMILTVMCIIPYVLVFVGSFTEEVELTTKGLKLLPQKFSLEAYVLIFADIKKILNGYKITTIVTLTGTLASLLVNSLLAYPLSKKTFKLRNAISFYAYFTMLFSGGMVPWYIVCTKYLGLHNNIPALILPYVVNTWYMFLIRNYFKTLPDEICESATVDGAGEFTIFRKIVMPLSIPVLASVTLFTALMYWNDWWLGIMLNEKDNLMPLQLMLRAIVSNTQFLSSENASQLQGMTVVPAEGVKYATTIITIGPILFLYPFLQKYFIKGLMVGAVKG